MKILYSASMYAFGIWHYILLIPIIPFFLMGKKVKDTEKAIFVSSFILFLLEVAKQVYYICIGYDVWIVPYQLCSIPLYIWLLWPARKTKFFRYQKVFLMTYTMLGAIGAFAYPPGMFLYPTLLVLHSFLWHYILVYMSSVCIYDKDRDLSSKSFLFATLIFYMYAAVAVVLNVILNKYGKVNLFYINPMPRANNPTGMNTQIGIEFIAKKLGIKGHFLYTLSIVLGSYLILLIVRACFRNKGNSGKNVQNSSH